MSSPSSHSPDSVPDGEDSPKASKKRPSGKRTASSRKKRTSAKPRPSSTPSPKNPPDQRRLGGRAPGIYRGLASWIEERLAEDLPDGGALPDHIELTVRLPFVGDRRKWRRAEREFRLAFENQLDAICDQLRTDELGYRDGHAFCPWCASPICEHSIPHDPRAIFIGYNPTGVPLWRDLGSWLLDQGDDRLDRLYESRPLPLARRIDGDALTAELLPEFGESMRPLVLVGAVVAGYFMVPRPQGGEQALALSALALERRSLAGAPRYTLNIVATLPPPHHLPTLLAERVVPILSDWVANLRRELSTVQDRWIEGTSTGRRLSIGECRALVERALENGANYLEKRLRRRQGRTDHAEERSADPERPTASALSDALAASNDSIFHDRRERTIIVRGPRNRIHVFRGDGTHITSILYTGESIRDRIGQGRWIPLEPARIEALRKGLKTRRQLDPTDEDVSAGS